MIADILVQYKVAEQLDNNVAFYYDPGEQLAGHFDMRKDEQG